MSLVPVRYSLAAAPIAYVCLLNKSYPGVSSSFRPAPAIWTRRGAKRCSTELPKRRFCEIRMDAIWSLNAMKKHSVERFLVECLRRLLIDFGDIPIDRITPVADLKVGKLQWLSPKPHLSRGLP